MVEIKKIEVLTKETQSLLYSALNGAWIYIVNPPSPLFPKEDVIDMIEDAKKELDRITTE